MAAIAANIAGGVRRIVTRSQTSRTRRSSIANADSLPGPAPSYPGRLRTSQIGVEPAGHRSSQHAEADHHQHHTKGKRKASLTEATVAAVKSRASGFVKAHSLEDERSSQMVKSQQVVAKRGRLASDRALRYTSLQETRDLEHKRTDKHVERKPPVKPSRLPIARIDSKTTKSRRHTRGGRFGPCIVASDEGEVHEESQHQGAQTSLPVQDQADGCVMVKEGNAQTVLPSHSATVGEETCEPPAPLGCVTFGPEFTDDIISHMKAKELKALWFLLEGEPHEVVQSGSPRAVLISWLILVQDHENLMRETLHSCVGLVDQYINRVQISVNNLQLLGVTTLLIASKYLERGITIPRLVYLTDNTYTEKDVRMMEWRVLWELDFRLEIPTSVFFSGHYLRVTELSDGVKSKRRMRLLVAYLCDLALPDLTCMRFSPSLRAAGAILLARIVFRSEGLLGGAELWSEEVEAGIGYSFRETFPVVKRLTKMLVRIGGLKPRAQAVHDKYAKSAYEFISTWLPVTKASPVLLQIMESCCEVTSV